MSLFGMHDYFGKNATICTVAISLPLYKSKSTVMKTTNQPLRPELHPAITFAAIYIVAITFSIFFCFMVFNAFSSGKSGVDKEEIGSLQKNVNNSLTLIK